MELFEGSIVWLVGPWTLAGRRGRGYNVEEVKEKLESLGKSNREIARRVVDFFDRVDELKKEMSLERERTLEQLEDFADEVDITRRERALFDLSNHTLHESSPSWRRGSETWRSREIFMVRKHLKDLSETMRPDVIRPEMFTNPLMRRMEAIREKARAGYRKDLLALCANRALSDDQLQDGRDAARLRYEKALAKLKPLEKRWELEVRIPMLIGSGVLKKSAEALLSRRS